MKSLSRTAVLALAASLTLGVAACGNPGEKDGKTPSVAAASGSEAVQEKFSHYTDGFNDLIDDNWGVSKQFASYRELNIPGASSSGSIYFPENISNLERALAKIKEGRALSGGGKSARADAAADKVLAQGALLLTQWQALEPYYETRAYRDDNLAKGKAAHPALVSAYEGTIAAIGELDAALTEYLRARDAARVEAYRKGGHTDAANVMQAMQLADHFSTAVIDKNIAEADRLMPQLEAALVELRKSETAMASGAENKVEFDLISGYLGRMVGAWRDYKQNGNDSERERIVDQYNDAVEQMNDIEFPAP